jgi:hypothetical protein
MNRKLIRSDCGILFQTEEYYSLELWLFYRFTQLKGFMIRHKISKSYVKCDS